MVQKYLPRICYSSYVLTGECKEFGSACCSLVRGKEQLLVVKLSVTGFIVADYAMQKQEHVVMMPSSNSVLTW
jgi:hypothetical protein